MNRRNFFKSLGLGGVAAAATMLPNIASAVQEAAAPNRREWFDHMLKQANTRDLTEGELIVIKRLSLASTDEFFCEYAVKFSEANNKKTSQYFGNDEEIVAKCKSIINR